MADRFLTDFELMVVLAILRVRDNAYGVPVAREIEQNAGRSVALAAVYLALDCLRQNGLVTFRLGALTAAGRSLDRGAPREVPGSRLPR